MSSQDLQSLFSNAQSDGLSHKSVDIMVQNLNGQVGLGCVGAQVDDLNTDDVTLLSVIIDQSSSMHPVKDDVIDAFNQMCRALSDSKSRDSILMSCWTFDTHPQLLFGYTPIDQVKDLTSKDYQPTGMTALYDATINGISGIVAYGQDLRNNGIRTRSIIIVISDGDDNSSRHTSTAVNTVAKDLIRQEFYTLAFIGLGDEQNFRQIASQMGFPEVLTVQNSASDIRKALSMVSGSVIRASQGMVNSGNNGFFSI